MSLAAATVLVIKIKVLVLVLAIVLAVSATARGAFVSVLGAIGGEVGSGSLAPWPTPRSDRSERMVEIKPSGPMTLVARFWAAETDFLWIARDVADTWFDVTESPMPIAIRFPPENPSETGRHDAFPYTALDQELRGVAYGALVLEVRAVIRATPNQWQASQNVHRALWHAHRAATRFLAWCKIRQPWIGAYESPAVALGDPNLADPDSGETRNLASPPRPRLEGGPVRSIDEPSLSAGEITDLARLAGTEEEPDAASAFLSDAYFAAFCTDPRDLKRAVLLAAFACEVRMRDMFRTHLFLGAEPQFEKWFPEERPYREPPVKNWPGSIAKALVGRSLEEEDSYLFGQFGELVDMRNALAHRGVVPPVDQALDGVRVARRLFRWLEEWNGDAPSPVSA